MSTSWETFDIVLKNKVSRKTRLKFYNIIFISYSANFVGFVNQKLTRIYLQFSNYFLKQKKFFWF